MSEKQSAAEDAGFTDQPPSYEESNRLMGHGPGSQQTPSPNYTSADPYNTQYNPQYGQQSGYGFPPQPGPPDGVYYRQGPPGMGYILPPEQQAPIMYGQPQQQPNVIHIVQCPASEIRAERAPPDHFMMAVMVTVFCFCPTGIIAVLRASESRSAAAAGNMGAAKRLSIKANRYINISIIAGILMLLLVVTIFIKNLIMGAGDNDFSGLFNTTTPCHDELMATTTTTVKPYLLEKVRTGLKST